MAFENRPNTDAAVRELQGLTMDVVAGADVDTNIAITGIAVEDTLMAVLHYTAGAAVANLTSEAAITSAGNIQLTTTDTTGDQLVVFWFNKK